MASPAERLASSLRKLHELRHQHIVAVRSTDISRTHRERLLRNGYLREVFKGWYVAIEPEEGKAASAAWYASYWRFCADYLNRMRDKQWCLSPRQSLALHTENWLIPGELRVRARKARNNVTHLPEGLSLLEMRAKLPGAKHVVVSKGLRLFSIPAALVHCGGRVFRESPADLRLALSLVDDTSELLELLLETGRSTVAGRLAGAFRNIGRDDLADAIMESMLAEGYDTRETDPFATPSPAYVPLHTVSLLPGGAGLTAQRIRLLWQAMRPSVAARFPAQAHRKVNARACLRHVDDICLADAWHSLAVDGIEVSTKSLEQARRPEWQRPADASDPAVLLARGHWQAFLAARASLERILAGSNAAAVIKSELGAWRRAMYAPLIDAGLQSHAASNTYRTESVPGSSRHVPPESAAVPGAMAALFEQLQNEKHPLARAVLGHSFLLYIKPFEAGNERLARLLMNVLLASGGLPWTIVPAEQADTYHAAIETAHVNEDIAPLAKLIDTLTQMLHLSIIRDLH